MQTVVEEKPGMAFKRAIEINCERQKWEELLGRAINFSLGSTYFIAGHLGNAQVKYSARFRTFVIALRGDKPENLETMYTLEDLLGVDKHSQLWDVVRAERLYDVMRTHILSED